MKTETAQTRPAMINDSIAHLVTDYRNHDQEGNWEGYVTGYGWCRFSNRLCAILIPGFGWYTY